MEILVTIINAIRWMTEMKPDQSYTFSDLVKEFKNLDSAENAALFFTVLSQLLKNCSQQMFT